MSATIATDRTVAAVALSVLAGLAMVAWPAAHGGSGVETFIRGENGVVCQKDLGPNTAALGAPRSKFNPDASWNIVK
jgi:hypothetical protein